MELWLSETLIKIKGNSDPGVIFDTRVDFRFKENMRVEYVAGKEAMKSILNIARLIYIV